MWISKRRYEALMADFERCQRSAQAVAEAKQNIIEDARKVNGELRANLAVAETTIEGLQRELSECKRVRDDYRELALRKGVTNHNSESWAQNQAAAAMALREGDERPNRPEPTEPGFGERLEQIFGDGLTNEQIAAMHMKDEE